MTTIAAVVIALVFWPVTLFVIAVMYWPITLILLIAFCVLKGFFKLCGVS